MCSQEPVFGIGPQLHESCPHMNTIPCPRIQSNSTLSYKSRSGKKWPSLHTFWLKFHMFIHVSHVYYAFCPPHPLTDASHYVLLLAPLFRCSVQHPIFKHPLKPCKMQSFPVVNIQYNCDNPRTQYEPSIYVSDLRLTTKFHVHIRHNDKQFCSIKLHYA